MRLVITNTQKRQTMETQSKMILAALEAGESLTPIDALNRFGCFRLGARIWDLRDKGYDIVTEKVRQGRKAWAKYSLRKKEN